MGLFSWLRGNRNPPPERPPAATEPGDGQGPAPAAPAPSSAAEAAQESLLSGFDDALGETFGTEEAPAPGPAVAGDDGLQPLPEALAADGFDNLVEEFFDFDDSADAADGPEDHREEAAGGGTELDAAGLAELRETFGGIAAGYVRPVRQFQARLLKGPVTTEWIDLCRPAIDTVARSAAGMGLGGLSPYLERFEALLHRVQQQGAREIAGADRDAILAAYADLAEQFPEAFTGEDDEDHRDSIIVQAVLRQVPEVGRVSLDKIFAAGLTSLALLEKASPEDLAVTTGVPTELAQAVCAQVRAHWDETAPLRNGASAAQGLELLSGAVQDLTRHHRTYGELGSARHTARDRKQSRVGRRNALLRVDALLAELGQVDTVEELQRLPVERRIEHLQELLAGMPTATATESTWSHGE